MFALLMGLLSRFGATGTGVIIALVGVSEFLPSFGVPEHVAHGVAWTSIGIAIAVFGMKWKQTDDRYVSSEAEKRILSDSLPATSTVPSIQREINKKLEAGTIVLPKT